MLWGGLFYKVRAYFKFSEINLYLQKNIMKCERLVHEKSVMKKVACLIVPLLFCFLTGANAYEKVATGDREYRKNTRGEGALTVKMIEKCVKLKHNMDEQYGTAGEEKSDLEARDRELQYLTSELTEERERLDPSDNAGVEEYNKKVELLNSKTNEYNELKEQYNAQIGPYKKQAKKFDKECKDQPYFEDDYEAVVKKLGYGM